MYKEDIKKLLEKYYNAQSSEEEELILKRFFREADIPSDLQFEKELFNYIGKSEPVPEPSEGFEERIIAAIDRSDSTFSIPRRRKLFITVTSIAAGLLILTGSYFFFINRTKTIDTFSDPRIAYAEAMKILYDVSVSMNRGTEALGTIGMMEDIPRKSLETINKSTTAVEDKLKILGYFNKAADIISGNKTELVNK
ncbi:MAG: hypothetical protein IQL11_15380 [Bacteroidales bacterium]|nr:hypothetical protein [Bacteroidales bacterium]